MIILVKACPRNTLWNSSCTLYAHVENFSMTIRWIRFYNGILFEKATSFHQRPRQQNRFIFCRIKVYQIKMEHSPKGGFTRQRRLWSIRCLVRERSILLTTQQWMKRSRLATIKSNSQDTAMFHGVRCRLTQGQGFGATNYKFKKPLQSHVQLWSAQVVMLSELETRNHFLAHVHVHGGTNRNCRGNPHFK